MKADIKKLINLIFILFTISLSTIVSAVQPKDVPLVTQENGRNIFGTFITSDLSQQDKQLMRNCLNSDQRFMSIDYTADQPLFLFGVPSNASFIGFEKTEINGIETIVANFDKNVDFIVFEAKDNQYIFKSHESSNKVIMTYLIDASYFTSLDDVVIPQLSYDWQQYIPASVKDDDGLEIKESSQIDSSSAVDTLKVQSDSSFVSQIKDYIWIGAGILVGLLALIGIIKSFKREKKQG